MYFFIRAGFPPVAIYTCVSVCVCVRVSILRDHGAAALCFTNDSRLVCRTSQSAVNGAITEQHCCAAALVI